MCADEARIITDYFANLGINPGLARISAMALYIHRRHCPKCRPDYSRTTYNMHEPKQLAYRQRKGGKG